VEGTGWQEQYLIDQGIIQNKKLGGGSLTDRLYCGGKGRNLELDISD